jgi:protein-tyrosine phosphatase
MPGIFERRLVQALLAGSALAAAPALAVAPADPSVVRQDAGRVTVSWSAQGPVDVLVADRADAPATAGRLVSARDGDGKAIIEMADAKRGYVLLRDVRSGDITRVAERVLPLEGGSNFRDIGGYPAGNGRHVRWGLIYRSGATPLITATDQSRIAALGLKAMFDLRSNEERVLAPARVNGVPYTAIGYSMTTLMAGPNVTDGMDTVYRRLPEMFAPHLRQIFAQLLRGEGPVAYNCSAGQDRTGFATAIVLSALGTPYPTIVADYHLSTTYRRPEFEMPRLDAATQASNPAAAFFGRYQTDPRYLVPQPLKTAEGKAYLDSAFAEMGDKWGGVDGYLRKEIGLTERDIARLRTLYTL